MDLGLEGKTFLVTGASSGIGLSTARTLSEEGASVAVHYRSNRESAEALAESLETPAVVVQADVASESDVDAMFETVLEAFSRLDGIVVNAGIWPETPTPVRAMSLRQWRTTLETDLTGAFLTCRGFLRHISRDPREEASIVLVGSTAALFGEEDHADYSAAKAGLTYGLTRSLKNEIVRLAPRGRVNCVCPGWVDTPMAASAMEDPEALPRATATMALAKVATAEDIAYAVAVLSSSKLSGHVSGAILPIAGGMEGRLLHP